MFEKSKTIIFIEGNYLKAALINFKNNQPIIVKKIENTFPLNGLTPLFIKIKQEFAVNTASILISETKSYLKLLEFPLNAPIDRNLVLIKTQELIPEQLIDGYFDWKQVSQNKEKTRVQTLAVSRDYLMPIQFSAQQAQIKLEAFEPPSFSLARLTFQEKEPHLITYQTNYVILVAAFQGQVYASFISALPEINSKSLQLTDYVKEKWGIEIKKTINKNLDPFIGLALKTDLEGKDENVLNLNPPEVHAKNSS